MPPQEQRQHSARPPYVAAALNLAAKLSDKKVSTDDKKALWTSADRNTRIMAGRYNSSNGVLSLALKDSIFNLVAPKLSDLEVKAAEVDENGTETSPAVRVSINLDKDNFLKAIKDISGCGKFAAKESVARGCGYYVTIEGDAADTFTVLFKYLHSEIKANKDAISTALGTVSTEPAVSAILKLVVNGVASLSAEKALRAVIKILPIVRAGVSVVKWIKVIFR